MNEAPSHAASNARSRAMRWVIAGLAAAALIGPAGPAPAAKKEKKPPVKSGARVDAEGVYAMSMTQSDTGLHIVEYWSRPSVLRAHTTLGGHPFVTLVDAETYYTLDPVFKRGVAIPRSPRAKAADKGLHRLFGNEFEEMRSKGAEKIRTEETPAGTLDVYRLTDDDGRRTVWVTSDDYHLPLKFETFIRATGETARLEYLSWAPLRLTDEFFAAPGADWDIERLPSYEAWLQADRTATFRQAPIIFPLLLHGRP